MNGPVQSLTPWVTEKFISAAPLAAAKALESLATHEALLLLKPLKAESLVACFNPMDAVKAAAILRRLPARQTAHVLTRLDVPQAAKIYQAFSQPQREKLKTLLPDSLCQTFAVANDWPPESAGAAMSRDFIVFKTDNKVADLIEKLKNIPRKKLPVACLICGKDGKPKGLVRTAELSFYGADVLAGSVMTAVQGVSAQEPSLQAVDLIKQGQPIVPVWDETGKVLGVLSLAELAELPAPKKRFGWF